MDIRYTALLLSLGALFPVLAQQAGPEQLHGHAKAAQEGVLARIHATAHLPSATADGPEDPYARLARRTGAPLRHTPGMRADASGFHGANRSSGYVVPMATVGDGSGTTYVTGATTSADGPSGHVFVMRVEADGSIAWEVERPVATYAVEMGFTLALDASGLYVAATHWNGHDMDLRLTKYGTDGTALWQQDHGGEAEGLETPTAMTIDAEGDVVVACVSWSGVGIDYLLTRFSPAGDLLWSAREAGVGGARWNEPTAVTTDAEGHVYVTGFSENEDFRMGYYTVKYSADGTALWRQRHTYQGHIDDTDPDSPLTDTDSYARALAVDADGNCTVTGSFYRGADRAGTIRYDADGQEQWIREFKSTTELTQGRALVQGDDGTLYVGGARNGAFSEDGFVLVAYSASGDSLWSAETDDLVDITVKGMRMDASGHLVIAGIASELVDEENFILVRAARAERYTTDGAPVDRTTYRQVQADTASFMDLAGTELADDGDVLFTLSAFYSARGAMMQMARFTAAATEPQWTTTKSDDHRPTGRMLNGFTDGHGNSYCTGDHLQFPGGIAYTTRFLVKYGSDGEVLWERSFHAGNGNDAEGIAAAADADGGTRVYLLPVNDFSGDPLPLRVKRLDPDGNLVWESGTALRQPALYSIVVDTQGNTYLSGTALPEGAEDPAFVVVKFDADGGHAWTSFHSVEGADRYGAGSAAMAPNGDLLLPGGAGTGSFFSEELTFTLTRFRPDGTVAWSRPVVAPDVSSGSIDVWADAEGNAYVNGAAADLNDQGFLNMMTARIDADGSVAWWRLYGDAGSDERSYTLRPLSNGDIVVVGYTLELSGEIHNVLVRYTPEGDEQWATLSADQRFFYDLHVDAEDNSYILDQRIISPFPYRLYGAPFASAVVVHINGDGDIVTEEAHTGPEFSEFFPERLLPQPDGRLVLAGTLINESYYEGIYLFPADLTLPTGVDETAGAMESGTVRNHPNPFRDRTWITLDLAQAGRVNVTVFDDQGRPVRVAADAMFGAGRRSIAIEGAGLAPGHYLYRVRTAHGTATGRMVVVD